MGPYRTQYKSIVCFFFFPCLPFVPIHHVQDVFGGAHRFGPCRHILVFITRPRYVQYGSKCVINNTKMCSGIIHLLMMDWDGRHTRKKKKKQAILSYCLQ
jgi:hypothetical protein